jgi:diguanylate cyclase (GGDEF)-like protein
VVLVAAVIACSAGQPFARLLWSSAYWTAVPFAIMSSVSLMLVVLWRDAPVYAIALVGPLVATVLYQRSAHSALKAMRLALTDQVTGLGNNRHFHERLQAELARAEAERFPLTLCLIDLDDFKEINDRFGHPAGDVVLAEVAEALRHGGDAFRVGGDEFALLLPGRDLSDGLETAQGIIRRLAGTEFAHEARVSFSAGVASYPSDGVERAELIRLADVALYRAKGDGKNRVRAYERDLREVARATAAAS